MAVQRNDILTKHRVFNAISLRCTLAAICVRSNVCVSRRRDDKYFREISTSGYIAETQHNDS